MMRDVDKLVEEAEKIDRGNGGNGKNESLYGFPVREPDERRVEERKTYDIKGLWSRHKEILQLDSLGYKGTEIAKLLGIHPVTVSNTLNSTLGGEAKLAIREERDEEYEQLREEVLDLTRISLDKYREILLSENATDKIQKDVADVVVLDLAGMRAPTKIQSMSAHTILTAEELEEFKRRGIEASRAAGRIIDIDESQESTE